MIQGQRLDQITELTMEDLAKSHPPAELREWILFKLNAAISRSMVKDFGVKETTLAIRPYALHMGAACAANFHKKYGYDGSTIEDVTMPMLWAMTCISRGKAKMEVCERGIVIDTMDCPLKGSSLEICKAVSPNVCEGIISGTSGHLKSSVTKYLSAGDGCCRFVFADKETISNGDLGRSIKVFDLDVSKEEQEAISNEISAEKRNVMMLSYLDLSGRDEFTESLNMTSREVGIDIKHLFEPELNGKNDIGTMAKVIDFLNATLMQTGSLKVNGGVIAEKEITECPFQTQSVFGCHQIEAMNDAICCSIDPNYEFRYDRMITNGDSSCHWTIRKKSASAMGEKKAETALDLLKKRLVRGEISVEQYHQLKDVLLEE